MRRHYLFGGGNSCSSKLKPPRLLAGGIECLVSPWDLPPSQWHNIYLIEESQIVARYYFRYFLSQDVNTTTQVQVVEFVLSYLVIAIITILFALDAIVSLCKTFRQEKSLLKPHICTNCQKKKWQKIKLNQAVHVGTAWLKVM